MIRNKATKSDLSPKIGKVGFGDILRASYFGYYLSGMLNLLNNQL